MSRKIIQIAAIPDPAEYAEGTVFALCDDGALFRYGASGTWEPMPPIPDKAPEDPIKKWYGNPTDFDPTISWDAPTPPAAEPAEDYYPRTWACEAAGISVWDKDYRPRELNALLREPLDSRELRETQFVCDRCGGPIWMNVESHDFHRLPNIGDQR